ncbi:hypothetical protein V495_01159 [Pseudogymnoascus sp. VKM F-4514 (FW-929)]|nr:hypothetical protein V490_00373 [Pseudogymnoascus sp. VKM F-3557]KFY48646.1 hypothetical protein V495_01159 [Pseudogymnoascus sp. VKM F-4514 (FW-929)]KFY67179.1 hypothetical protein V497_00519 [Pseudogymnoascus sp. VKM F-4516 (FW-969)]
MPLTTEEQDKAYASLEGHKKAAVDTAMALATEGKYLEAISSFASDCEKISFGNSLMIMTITRCYQKSPEDFREGLLGFFV